MAEHMSQTHAAFRETDMSVVKEERYVFKVDWFDKQAQLIRNYLLTFYPSDASVEMVSSKAGPSASKATFNLNSNKN